jgi:hypothetical protein
MNSSAQLIEHAQDLQRLAAETASAADREAYMALAADFARLAKESAIFEAGMAALRASITADLVDA